MTRWVHVADEPKNEPMNRFDPTFGGCNLTSESRCYKENNTALLMHKPEYSFRLMSLREPYARKNSYVSGLEHYVPSRIVTARPAFFVELDEKNLTRNPRNASLRSADRTRLSNPEQPRRG